MNNSIHKYLIKMNEIITDEKLIVYYQNQYQKIIRIENNGEKYKYIIRSARLH